MTPEGKVKREVREILRSYGKKVFWFMPVTTGMGVRGVPDFICCINGRYLGIETKANGNRTTLLQDIRRDEIKEAGGYWLLINEDNLEAVSFMVDELLSRSKK